MRLLVPTLLPALWHIGAQAQLLAPDVIGSGDASSAVVPGAAGRSGPFGPGLLATPSGRSLRIRPRLALTETLTDNVALSSVDRRADLVTQLTAGVQLVSTGGRTRGFVDYALTGIHYASGSASPRLQNTLSASLNTEVIEKRAFIDVTANIATQSLSAFGTQSVDPALNNSNRTEVRTYRVSPYLRGAVSRFATYDLRFSREATHVSNSAAGDVASSSVSLLLVGTGSRIVNWTLNGSHQVVDYALGSRREADRATAALLIMPLPELRITLTGGRESNNFVSEEKAYYTVRGARLTWNPTPRTSLIADRQYRYFGTSHLLSLSYRMARSTLIVSDSQDAFISGTQGDSGLRVTAFELYSAQFAAVEPDPVLRRVQVEALLRARGIDPAALLPVSLLSSATSLARSQLVAYTLFGLRDTLSVVASRSNTQRLDTRLTAAAGDLNRFSSVRQQSLGVTLGHRLTPVSSLSATFSQQRNFGDAGAGSTEQTRLQSAYVSLATRINPRAGASLAARHTRFESTALSYRESALIANLNVTF